MTTTRWRSSLANVETRLRRSLGLSGPIDLALDDPPILTPVIIADDATRPGTASEVRGRRFRATRSVATTGLQTGSVWLFVEPPAPFPSSVTTRNQGGVIIDDITVTVNCNAAATAYQLMLSYFSTNLVLAPGIPVALQKQVYFVDPMKANGEPADLQIGADATVSPSVGTPIAEMQFVASGAANNVAPYRLFAGDLFLNWNSAICLGNVNPVAAVLYVNFAGRIF